MEHSSSSHRRGTIYHMIFAADNAARDRMMSDLYSAAAQTMPAMQREAPTGDAVQAVLDLGDGPASHASYVYEPPRPRRP
jgi:hypothetical protein